MPDPAMPDQTPSTPPVDPTQAVYAAQGVPALSALANQTGALSYTPDEVAAKKREIDEYQRKKEDAAEQEVNELNQEQIPAPPVAPSGLLDRLAPLLVLTAFGGAATKAPATSMFAATIGATKGFLDGNQQAWQTAQEQYKNNLDALKLHMDQVDKTYRIMQDAYSDRIDGDIKALQFARMVNGDAAKQEIASVDMWRKMQDSLDKLQKYHDDKEYHDQQMDLRVKALQEKTDHDRMMYDAQIKRLQFQSSKAEEKQQKKQELAQSTTALIDDLIQRIQQHPGGTGLRGTITRAGEAIGQSLGANVSSDPTLIRGDLSQLQLNLAQLDSIGGRPSKEIMNALQNITSGTNFGATDPNTIASLTNIRNRIAAEAGGQAPAEAPQIAVNPQTGQKVQLKNGQWVPIGQ